MNYVLSENAARKLRALLRKSDSGSVNGASAGRFEAREYALPFTMQWSETSGGWIIWIPGEAIEASVLDPLLSSLTAVGGDYPSGWYNAGIEGTAGDWVTVYINIQTSNGSIVSASLSTTRGSEAVPVAHIYEGNDGERAVKQLIVSYNEASSGGGGGTGGLTGTYTVVTGSDYTDDYKVVNHRIQMVFTNGLLTCVNNLTDEEVFTTVPHSTSMDS